MSKANLGKRDVIGAALLALALAAVPAASAQSTPRASPKQPVGAAASVKPGLQGKLGQAAQDDAPANFSGFTIGEQDVLAINVLSEPEVSGIVVVRPDGRITLPLVNELRVAGMTPEELRAFLTEKLRPYLTVPQVTVTVREINSRRVYILGQVRREGSFHLNANMTVLQLIAEAEGLRDFANRKKIYVLRNENGKQVRYPFNYEDVIKGDNDGQNIVLRPGDTVVVP